jgi:hypothetical protein
MSDTKVITITGQAKNDLTTNKNKNMRKRNTKKNQTGGANTEQPSTNINIVKGVELSTVATSAGSPNPNTWLKYPVNAPVPPVINKNTIIDLTTTKVSPEIPMTQQGGMKQIKVELKKKNHSKKVHLNPKKIENPKSILSKKQHTKKNRKVTFGLHSLHKRMTRAKKIHKQIKDLPIDKLKDKLVKGGLIKSTSKAPEHIIRQIATDAEVVAKKIL